MKAWIVWNNAHNEGVIFSGDGADIDAHEASTGKHGNPSSALAGEFFNLYQDDDKRPIQEIEI